MMVTNGAGQASVPPADRGLPDFSGIHTGLLDIEARGRSVVRQQPVVAVLAAAGLGYLVARLVARASR